MFDHLPETALNLFAALVLGCAIGFERQWHQRMAGLRTNTLVAIGAAIFVTFAALFPGESSPTRMAAQVVSGIGFLGAGIIFKEGLNVRGLNTAATLWCSAGVGTLCGAGFYPHAAVCTAFVIVVNLLLRPLVHAIELRLPLAPDLKSLYTISIVCHGEREADVRGILLRDVGTHLHIQEIESTNIEDSNRVEVNAIMRADQRQDRLVEHMIGRLSLEPLVTSARWRFERV